MSLLHITQRGKVTAVVTLNSMYCVKSILQFNVNSRRGKQLLTNIYRRGGRDTSNVMITLHTTVFIKFHQG